MNRANRLWDRAVLQVQRKLGIRDPLRIMPYKGYGTPWQVRIKGRVLEKEGIRSLSKEAAVLRNLVNMYRRFDSDEVPEAKLKVCIGDCQTTVTANREGFFTADLTVESPLSTTSLWSKVHIELLDPPPRKQSAVTATGEVVLVTPAAQFGVISDIDDTVVYTAASNPLEMIRIAYLGNARSRRPFAGVAAFYHALQKGADSGSPNPENSSRNPIFYISSSPWNMYDLFDKFMNSNSIPKGPILLRDIELSPANLMSFSHREHKREQIDPLLTRFSDLPFILFGDSGQKDAEIYAQIVKDYPDRILAVYIRDALPDDDTRHQQIEQIAQQIREAGTEFLLFLETVEAATHAAEKGWIAKDAIAKVKADLCE
ncbi:MAG: phosphatase domain-containing protein [Cyanobacteria bacterium P01_D01_bin.1]